MNNFILKLTAFISLNMMTILVVAELHVVVTPTRSQQELVDVSDVQLHKTTATNTVITRQSFDSEVATVADVLERNADITVRKTGGIGGFSVLSVRGSTSQQVLVLLDGVPVNDINTGLVDLSQYSLDLIERIEVYKGSLPLEFGVTAVGGAINLVTRKAGSGYTDIGLGGGSFQTQKAALMASQHLGDWRYLLSLDQLKAENNFPFRNDAGTNRVAVDDFDDHRENNQFKRSSALIKADYLLTPTARLSLSLNYLNKQKNLPAISNSADAQASLETDQLRYSIAAASVLDNEISWKLGFGGRKREETFLDLRPDIGLKPQKIDYSAPSYNVSFLLAQETDWGRWNTQISGQKEKFSSLNQTRETQDSNVSCFSTGTCSLDFGREQYKWAIGGDKVYGQQRWSGSVNALYLTDENGSETPRMEGQELGARDYVTAQLGWSYDALLSWKVNASSAVRVPTSYELFGDVGLSKGNESLKTERSTLLEVEALYKKHGWNNVLTLFTRGVNDLIVPERDSRGITRYDNVSRARINGVEVKLAKHFFNGVFGGISSVFLDSHVESEVIAFDGKMVAGTYHRNERFNIGWQSPRWSTEVIYIRSQGLVFDRANLVKAGLKNQIDFTASYQQRRWKADFEVRNILNDSFFDFDRQPTQGRSAFFFLKYRI